MRKITSLTFVLLLAVAGFAVSAPEVDAIGFCEVETDCDAECYCSAPSHQTIVPAWCCPNSPCYDNRP